MSPQDNPAEQLVGAILSGSYKLTRLLGEGGMGAVYEAESLRGDGRFAVKILHPEFVNEAQVVQRFFAEAQAAGSLAHPNVARIFSASTAEDGTPYLVMELLQGIPLASYIDQGSAIAPQQAVSIIVGILQALSAAHHKRIVHRDLKPDNVFLVRDDAGFFQVKVLDFGIAKVMDAAGGMGSKTRTGVLLGTPGYMSPEQIKNAKGVDPRSDLWSVAIILYEMLTAQEPFPSANEFARLTAVLTEEPIPVTAKNPALGAWVPYFARALAKDPNQRFQSAEEMATATMRTLRGEPLAPAQPAAPPSQLAPASMQGPSSAYAPPAGQPSVRPSAHPPAPPSGYIPPTGFAVQPTVPQAGGPSPAQPTYVSAVTPGASAYIAPTPVVAVVSARPRRGKSLWVIAAVAIVACLALGVIIGLAFGGG